MSKGSTVTGSIQKRNRGVANLIQRTKKTVSLLKSFPAHVSYMEELEFYGHLGLIDLKRFNNFKYLGRYLSRSFDSAQKREAILSHYRLVSRVIPNKILNRIVSTGLVIWHITSDECHCNITLHSNVISPLEGEWQISFYFNGTAVYHLSLSFCRLGIRGHTSNARCIIGGVQGVYQSQDAIRHAAKLNSDISPATILILAARAIASVIGVETVYGVSSSQHVSSSYAGDRMKTQYNDLWTSNGGQLLPNEFYLILSQSDDIHSQSVSSAHRRRKERRRKLRSSLLEQITDCSRDALLNNAD
ncbi:DUF535 family protein [Sphingomonas glacialis]|uniref:DUF535 domain-containing protein n=1 Tax=Sphingomonas glacialis TaxID=658225 RepID=A0A502FB41_9SPHN|nr:DUF535 family protein [Sphingomonas glacialis]TPG46509.1 DUF535 domain-containing protein [Sphingomonas glacialis]